MMDGWTDEEMDTHMMTILLGQGVKKTCITFELAIKNGKN